MADSNIDWEALKKPFPAIDWEALKKPFPAKDIEWRVQRSGIKNGKGWASVLAYVTNRAIQNRLDEVVGPDRWRNTYEKAPEGGVLCGIGILIEKPAEDLRASHEWVIKYDGAANTEVESVKGGLSSSMKRAAVQWGIGRYLYELEGTFVEVKDKGQNYIAIKENKNDPQPKIKGYWDDPQLPPWALPEGQQSAPKPSKPSVGTSTKPLEAQIKLLLARSRDASGLTDRQEALYDMEARAATSMYFCTDCWSAHSELCRNPRPPEGDTAALHAFQRRRELLYDDYERRHRWDDSDNDPASPEEAGY